MKLERIEDAFADERGAIRDVLGGELIDHVSIIESAPGAVRGNHVHRETSQWLYLLEGDLQYVVQTDAGDRHEGSLAAGDLLLTGPGDAHAFVATTPSRMLVLTRGPRGGKNYEADTFRLDEPLIARS